MGDFSLKEMSYDGDDMCEDKQMSLPSGGYFQGAATKKIHTSSQYSNIPSAYSSVPEYTLMNEYSCKDASKLFDTLGNSLVNNTWELMDLAEVRESTNQILRFLEVSKRYRRLQSANPALGFSTIGFHIEDHVFTCLDEVERALNNKAFL